MGCSEVHSVSRQMCPHRGPWAACVAESYECSLTQLSWQCCDRVRRVDTAGLLESPDMMSASWIYMITRLLAQIFVLPQPRNS